MFTYLFIYLLIYLFFLLTSAIDIHNYSLRHPQKGKEVAEKRVTPSAQKKEKTLEKLLQKLELVEQFLLKNYHLYPLSADQVKSLQKIIQSENKEKLSVAQVKKLVEIARRQWKKD